MDTYGAKRLRFAAEVFSIAAQTTDTPVWWLFGATAGLACITLALATAAIKALGRLQVAVQQLEEVKRDRLVQVFSDLARRWEGAAMTEALAREIEYSPAQLAKLFAERSGEPLSNPLKERRRRQRERERLVLLRVPNYFEDALMIAKAGGLEAVLSRENFGGVALDEWRQWKPAVKALQKADELAFVEFERLAEEVEAEDAARQPATTTAGS